MDEPSERSDDVVVLPPVAVDPVFAEAVDDAVAGEQPPTSAFDPQRLLGADPHDFAGLYIRHRSSFALHARRFLRDPRDVDEVVQEAFLRLFLALPELETELQALAYCRRTITNLCIDRYRADQRRPRMVDLESVPVDVLGDDEPDDPVIQAEDAALVREALALLSPLHRDALVKREIEEKPLPVIAEELGVAEDSVKHLLHRARRALRRRLAETHLAPGADLDDVSTLSLLARSAVSGSSRLGVFVVLACALVLGVTAVPQQTVQTISGLWRPDPAPLAADVGEKAVEQPPLPRPDGPLGLDDPGPIVAGRDVPGLPPGAGGPAAVAPVVPAGPATTTVETSASPAPSASPSGTPVPQAPLPVVPTLDPRPEPSSSPEPSPTPSSRPDATAKADDRTDGPAGERADGGAPAAQEGGPVRMPVSRRTAAGSSSSSSSRPSS